MSPRRLLCALAYGAACWAPPLLVLGALLHDAACLWAGAWILVVSRIVILHTEAPSA